MTNRKTKIQQLSLKPDVWGYLRQQAEEKGLSVSAWVERMVLERHFAGDRDYTIPVWSEDFFTHGLVRITEKDAVLCFSCDGEEIQLLLARSEFDEPTQAAYDYALFSMEGYLMEHKQDDSWEEEYE